MLHWLRHRLGYLILLLLFVPGLVLTRAGESCAHGPLIAEVTKDIFLWARRDDLTRCRS